MSYQERRAIVSVLSTAVIWGLYFSYMLQRYPEGNAYSPEVFKYWGTVFAILIPVTIVARILIIVLFSILNTIATRVEEPEFTDERDRLISLKATRNSTLVFIVGFALGMTTLAFDIPPVAMFIVFFISGVVSEMVSELSELYFYRRGV
ncbi:MAG: hypothetical protein L6Q98_01910 [Anaerolineae bacterium]|nr:hypothetical protein [Anaerolineae bacterium]NUQ05886.1 hypothetical protein [Anaerolineae bacterium]